MALGATGVQLGIVNSIGMVVAGFCSPFTGWIIDRIGPKKIYLFGIAATAAAYLCYGWAQSWELTILAMGVLLVRIHHQYSQLRNHMRQLPAQPGPGHRDAHL